MDRGRRRRVVSTFRRKTFATKSLGQFGTSIASQMCSILPTLEARLQCHQGQRRERIELRPAIITTNYDVLAESGLNAGLPRGAEKLRCFYPGFKDPNIELASSGFKRQSPTIFEDDPIAPMADGLVPIIKLHGSVNWFRTSKSDPPDQWLAFQNFGSREPGQFCGINKAGLSAQRTRP